MEGHHDTARERCASGKVAGDLSAAVRTMVSLPGEQSIAEQSGTYPPYLSTAISGIAAPSGRFLRTLASAPSPLTRRSPSDPIRGENVRAGRRKEPIFGLALFRHVFQTRICVLREHDQ